MSFPLLFVDIPIYALAGVFAGLVAGLMGVGGGVVVVPSLFYLFSKNEAIPPQVAVPLAIGTSMTIMALTAPSAIRAHYRRGGILWPVYKLLLPGLLVGTILGALLADFIPSQYLEGLFGSFLLFVALRMLWELRHHPLPVKGFPRLWVNRLVSAFIGCQSGLLGIGGGALIIPYLHYCGLNMRKISPISALCTVSVALFGSLSYILMGLSNAELPAYSLGFVYWPAVLAIAIPSAFFAPLGVKLAYILPSKLLKCSFILLLLATAFQLIF